MVCPAHPFPLWAGRLMKKKHGNCVKDVDSGDPVIIIIIKNWILSSFSLWDPTMHVRTTNWLLQSRIFSWSGNCSMQSVVSSRWKRNDIASLCSKTAMRMRLIPKIRSFQGWRWRVTIKNEQFNSIFQYPFAQIPMPRHCEPFIRI